MTTYHPGKKNPDLIAILNTILADTAVVYYKTHGFHWNVEGPEFYSLHKMFETFYQTLWQSLDDIAERIRALGGKAPSSLAALLKNATIAENEATPVAAGMLDMLRENYLVLAKKMQEVAKACETQGDLVTSTMVTDQATFLEKAAWMLQSARAS